MSEAKLSTRLESAFDWTPGWKPEVDTRDGAEQELRFAAMETGDAPREVTLRARRAGAPLSRNAIGPIYLQVTEDGTFVTSSVPIDVQTTEAEARDTTTVDVAGTAGMSAGRWSILGPGRLAGCADLREGTAADAAVSSPGFDGLVPPFGPPGGGEAGSVAYNCAAGAMSTRVQMGRFGEVEFPFRRLSPPPEE